MSFKYKNITNNTQILPIISEDKTSVSHISVEPGGIFEVNVTLDTYVPHILAKLDDLGFNISHLVLKARQEISVVVEKAEEEFKKVEEEVKEIIVPAVETSDEVSTEEPKVEEEKANSEVETPVTTVKPRRNKKN